MGAYSIDPATCVGCTLCARNCPVKAIAGKLKEPHAIDPAVCVGCGACGRLCPKGAVVDDKGYSCGLRWNRPLWKVPGAVPFRGAQGR